MLRLLHPLILLLVILFSGCSSGNPAPQSPAPGDPRPGGDPASAEPYVVSGRVTDSQGKPLAGVEVFADNTAYYDTNLYGVTNSEGKYRIELGGIIPSSWRVGAYLEREFHGSTFRYSLHPDTAAVFAGADGAIRNLQWRLSGGTPEGGYYGGLIYAYEEGFMLDMEAVELTLVPVGPLIDGSDGTSRTSLLERGLEITDVPVGNYRVTARYLPADGPAADLLIRLRGTGVYAASVTAPLVNTDYYGPLLSLEVKKP